MIEIKNIIPHPVLNKKRKYEDAKKLYKKEMAVYQRMKLKALFTMLFIYVKHKIASLELYNKLKEEYPNANYFKANYQFWKREIKDRRVYLVRKRDKNEVDKDMDYLFIEGHNLFQ